MAISAGFVARVCSSQESAHHFQSARLLFEIGQTAGRTRSNSRGRVRRAPGIGEVEIEVAAAALNFRDLPKSWHLPAALGAVQGSG